MSKVHYFSTFKNIYISLLMTQACLASVVNEEFDNIIIDTYHDQYIRSLYYSLNFASSFSLATAHLCLLCSTAIRYDAFWRDHPILS
jgi:hypothetical protein